MAKHKKKSVEDIHQQADRLYKTVVDNFISHKYSVSEFRDRLHRIDDLEHRFKANIQCNPQYRMDVTKNSYINAVRRRYPYNTYAQNQENKKQ